jgi:large subunit ribosomal protein L13
VVDFLPGFPYYTKLTKRTNSGRSVLDYKTHYFKASDVKQQWHLIDAGGKTLGRVATEIARLLRGKHNPRFTPNSDVGDYVIVINASKVKVTGKRQELKNYFHYTGYPGGGVTEQFQVVLQKHPERVIEHAVKGMLPKTRLGRQIFGKLKVYRGSDHPHAAQTPAPYSFQS